jgi:predicted GNAT family acetyltransferase
MKNIEKIKKENHGLCGNIREARQEAASSSTAPVNYDIELQRFELQTDGAALAFLSYVQDRKRIDLDHTFVPDDLRGNGIAANLVRTALNVARQRNRKVIPRCSYVAGFIKRHPEFPDLLEPELQS